MKYQGIRMTINECRVGTPFRSADAVLLMVMEGNITCHSNCVQNRLHVGDFLFLRPFETITIMEESKGTTMSFHWTEQFLRKHGALSDIQRVSCCSLELTGKSKLEVQNKLSELFWMLSKQNVEDSLLIQGIGLTLLGLLREYGVEEYEDTDVNLLADVLRDIHQHCGEAITIQQIAQNHYISAGYLTKLFRRQLGRTPLSYLNELRMKNAMNALLYTQNSVTEIALNNGFSNATAFIEKFKQVYGTTPKKYRDGQKKIEEPSAPQYQQMLEQAASMLEHQFQIHSVLPKPTMHVQRPDSVEAEISYHAGKNELKHSRNWQSMLNIGWAKDALLEPIQKQLMRLQSQIPHKYLRFHGIFDEEMRIFSDKEDGMYNFRYIDMVFDFILNIGLLPYVELGFLPKKMAEGYEQQFAGRCYVGIPHNMQKWNELVAEFIQHCIIRYGRSCVREWKFTVMDGLYEYYRVFTMEEYAEFFCNNYRLIKQFDEEIAVGGPGHDLDLLVSSRRGELDKFLSICKKNHCVPDFICFQYFHSRYNDAEKTERVTIDRFETHQNMPVQLDENPNSMQLRLNELEQALRENDISDVPLVLQAWNATLWQHDLTSDTCYKAAFLAKNILENQSRLEMMGYWTASDLFDDHDPEHALYYGGYGLFTYTGIPKAGYYALDLLAQLDGTIAAQGRGYYVTRTEEEIQILLYHYTHFDRMYLEHYSFTEDRYGVFMDENALQFTIRLKDIPAAYYTMESYQISKEGGSSYDAWVRMGSPMTLHSFQQDYLEKVSVPVYQTSTEYLEGEYLVSATLMPHEVQLIVIRQTY